MSLPLGNRWEWEGSGYWRGFLRPIFTHMNTHTHTCILVLSVCQVGSLDPSVPGREIGTGTKKALKPDVAQSSPLLRPCRLPLFTRRLNEAAGAAEMNQSPAWDWEGRRTGRPARRVGETSRAGLAQAGVGW